MKIPIYNSILSWIIKKRLHSIDLFVSYPLEVQEEWRGRLIEQAKDTLFGKKYDFDSIKNYEDFRSQIPLHHYEDLEPYINKARSGMQNVLWPSEIKWFAKSSGTTNSKSKFIPVSTETLEDCHYKGGKDLLALYCKNTPEHQVFDGKSLMLGGCHQMSPLSESMHEGDLSAIIMENLPFWVQLQQSPDKEIALMSEWEEKIEKMAEQAIHEDITSLSGVPSWTLVLAQKVLEKTGKDNLQEVWPNFELYMHGGISFKPYQGKFEKLFPKGISYVEIYNASEGFFGIQDNPNRKDMLLMLDYGIFYEFLPLEEIDKENPKAIPLSEVEIEKDYALIISTNSGLWRYVIGDTVQFTQKKPYRFIISGRTKHFINAFGEELMIHNSEKALHEACKITGASVSDYTAAPYFLNEENEAYHEWMIEFSTEPKDLNDFGLHLDNALKSLNSDYEAKRYKNMLLKGPVIHKAQHKLFYNWMKKRGKLGGQHKVPRLSNERKYLEELLEMNKAI